MKVNKKQITVYDQIYDKIQEYRKTLITTVIIMIPIVFVLYLLNIHNYIFPETVIFRLDIYYRYFGIIFLLMHLYELFYKKDKPSISDWFLYLFIIMTIISTIFAKNTTVALFGYPNRYEGLYTLMFYSFLYLNCKRIKDNDYVKSMTKIIISVSIIHLLVVILQLTGLFSKLIYMYNSGDAIGLTENCNFLGSLMCMISMLTSGAYLLKIDKNNVFYLIGFVVSYVTLLLANSTGPFISFIGTFILFFIYLLVKKKLVLKNFIVCLLIIIMLYPVVLYKRDDITPEIKSHINYFVEKIDGNNNDDSNKGLTTNQLGHGRVKIWKNTWKTIKKSPLIGYGPDNLGLVYEKSVGEKKIADKAHNIYLHIFASSGIFALIGYIGFVITNIINSLESKNGLVIEICFAIIAYSIQGIFNINVSEVTPYFYILLGFMMSLLSNETIKNNK